MGSRVSQATGPSNPRVGSGNLNFPAMRRVATAQPPCGLAHADRTWSGQGQPAFEILDCR